MGEQILSQSATCLRAIVLANAVDKKITIGFADGSANLRELRASVEVIRGFLLLAWKLKFLSHGALAELSVSLEAVSRQAARWQQWFERQSAHASI